MHTHQIVASIVLAMSVLFLFVWGERALNDQAGGADRILGIERCVWLVTTAVATGVSALVLAVMVLAGATR